MSKHYATRMKEEIAQLQANIRELVLDPESMKSMGIKKMVNMEVYAEAVYWAGDSSIGGGGIGIMAQIHAVKDSDRIVIKDDNVDQMKKDYYDGEEISD